jgi:hypothetical protein
MHFCIFFILSACAVPNELFGALDIANGSVSATFLAEMIR